MNTANSIVMDLVNNGIPPKTISDCAGVSLRCIECIIDGKTKELSTKNFDKVLGLYCKLIGK